VEIVFSRKLGKDEIFMRNMALVALMLAALACCSCGKSGPSQSKNEVILAGSTSVQPFADYLVEKYHEVKPDVTVNVQGGGSSAGIKAVREGAAMIGMSSRELTDEEKKGLTPIVIAHDGIALIVHNSNTVSNLTLEQIQGIFSGKISDWSEVGGAKGAIRPVTREAGSGTRAAFTELVMKETSIANTSVVQNSNGAVREVISKDQQAIGYISMGIVDQSVKAVSIDGVAPNKEDVVTGKYKLVRPFIFITKGPAQGAAREFIDFVLSDEGQKILESKHLIRAKQ
jgi:phosphate transport system substrate-binding protein